MSRPADTINESTTQSASYQLTFWDWSSLALLASLVALALGAHDNYGITWDELIHWDYGDAVLRFYTSMGVEEEAKRHPDSHYGPAYDLLGAVARACSPIDDLHTMRLLGIVVGLLGVIGAWRLGRLLGGPRAGFLALVFLVLTPSYAGQVSFNVKDIPFAVGYTWSLYYLVRLALDMPRFPVSLIIKLALAMALASSVRIAGVVTWLFAIILVAGFLLRLVRCDHRSTLRVAQSLLLRVLVSVSAAFAIMVALWPWAHLDPIRRPLRAFFHFSHYEAFTSDTRVAGESFLTSELPRDYLPKYFLYQIPEIVLVLILAGSIVVLVRLLRSLSSRRPFPTVEGLLSVAALFPVAYVVFRSTPIYDGLRQFLFIMPIICVGAGLTASSILDKIQRFGRLPVLAVTGVFLISPLWTVREIIRLHPYEYAYFNRLAGGFAGAADAYETDYYGLSFKELCDLVTTRLWETEPGSFLNSDYAVVACVLPFFYEMQATGNLHFAGTERPDLFLGYRRHDCLQKFQGAPVLSRVERLGHTLAVARDLRGGRVERP